LPFDDLPNWGLSYGLDATPQKEGAPFAHARAITPGLLETIGVPLIEGRFFTEHDGQAENPVVIIDDVMAQRLWPDQSALGQEFMLGQGQPDRRVSVVGVVRHVKQRSLMADVGPQIFLPYRLWQRWPMALVLRSDSFANPTALVAGVRAAVARFDPHLPIYDVRPLEAYLEAARSTRHFTMLLAGAFAVSALALTSIGLYGVLSCAVAHRRHEFGVRSALGAVPRQLRCQVLRESLKLAAAGCVVGIALALCLTRLLQSQLYGTHPWDPMTCGAAIALVFAGAVIASWIPAHRATTISPMEALKCE
jgi:predicted permease